MKFRIKHFVSMAVALGLLTSCAGGMDSGDTVKARRDLMRNNNANLKAIGAFLKAGKGSAADVATRARKVAANAQRIKGLFPKGTSLKDLPGKTRAKPNIWARAPIHNQNEEMAAFKQAADMMGVYATRLAEAAGSGDKKAIGAALGNLGKRGCGGCHGQFRGPKPKN